MKNNGKLQKYFHKWYFTVIVIFLLFLFSLLWEFITEINKESVEKKYRMSRVDLKIKDSEATRNGFSFIWDYRFQKLEEKWIYHPPCKTHLMGTDELGRDLFSRVLRGIKNSLIISFGAGFLTLFLGVFTAYFTGYFNIFFSKILISFFQFMLSFPVLGGMALYLSVSGPDLYKLILVIGFFNWPGFSESLRMDIKKEKQEVYISSAIVAGASEWRIFYYHLFPALVPKIFLLFILSCADGILYEACLSYLGIGLQPPEVSLGKILATGRETIETAWWMTVFPLLGIYLIFRFLSTSSRKLENKLKF